MYDFADQKKMIYITFAIILFISSFLAPLAVFYPLKVAFITPEAISIGTSFISLLTGGFGIALIAGGLLALALIASRMKKYIVAGILFAAGISGVLLSLSDYYYMTADGFTYNSPFSVSSQSYEWAEFEKIEERIGKEDNASTVQSIAMYLKNGDVIEMSSGKIFEMRGDLVNRIEEAGGLYERVDLEQ